MRDEERTWQREKKKAEKRAKRFSQFWRLEWQRPITLLRGVMKAVKKYNKYIAAEMNG